MQKFMRLFSKNCLKNKLGKEMPLNCKTKYYDTKFF